ncbi:hypothetical protein F4780DRAFT_7478 [Xylariomycetidae sp. FL0641]|nr:hypothetical protein F4780DRAFT_7478 [Xylariomycetidae sp. FL0641]
MSTDDDWGSAASSNLSGRELSYPRWPHCPQQVQEVFQRSFLNDGVTIPFDELPQVSISILRLNRVAVEKARTQELLFQTAAHSTCVRRRLNAPEVQAIGEHSINYLRLYDRIVAATVCGAALAATLRARVFGFPLYRPKMHSFDPYSFPRKSKPLLTGPPAAAMWHFLRFLCYMPVVGIPLVGICVPLAKLTLVNNLVRDPRLTPLYQEMDRLTPRNRNQNQYVAAWRMRMEMEAHARGRAKPSSPAEQPPMRSGYPSQTFPSQPSVGPSPYIAGHPHSPPAYIPPGQRGRDEEADDDPLGEDDASPVSPSSQDSSTGQPRESYTGSAWDRLRQQSGSRTAKEERPGVSGEEQGWAKLRNNNAKVANEHSASDEDYTYSSAEEEKEKRRYDKEQAQKEFDALLERERRGEGDSRGSRR